MKFGGFRRNFGQTGVAEKYYMTISDTAIELREPNLIRDDTVYVYLLLEETDVVRNFD